MKTGNIIITIALMAACLAMGCADFSQKEKNIKISGEITAPAGDSISLESPDFRTAAALDSSGLFTHNFIDSPGYYTMRHGRERTTLYLEPGFNLEMKLNTREFDESLSFKGKGAVENNYLAEKYLFLERNTPDVKSMYLMPEAEFLDYSSDMQGRLDSLLNSYLESSSYGESSEIFRSLERKNIKYEILSYAIKYDNYHGYFTGNEEFASSDNFKNQFVALDYNNENDYRLIPSFRELAKGHYLAGEFDEVLDRLDTTSSKLIVQDMLEMMISYLSPGKDDLDLHIRRMIKLSSDPDFIQDLEKKQKDMLALKKGEPSPEFNYESINGEWVSLKDLRGKNVYIDVWATWCGPCKAEIPHLKALEEEFSKENIAFVSISVDEPADKSKWEKMVKDKDLQGIQLITDKGWDTDFTNSYLINSIPRFILIDTEGRIVNADAPRPSSKKKIREMLKSLGA